MNDTLKPLVCKHKNTKIYIKMELYWFSRPMVYWSHVHMRPVDQWVNVGTHTQHA